jgi:Zn-dependent protease
LESLTTLSGIVVAAVPVIIAITSHEAAHGFVAWRLGDDTAYQLGRVTFNPFKHIDAFGTVLLPAMLILLRAPFLFGWAKPVPVNFQRLRRPRRDMVLVAAAGPGVNLLLAVASALLLHIVELFGWGAHSFVGQALTISIFINVILAVFNMLPLPPLDGGRVAVGLLPHWLARPLARLEPVGLFVLILVLFVLPLVLGQFGIAFSPFRSVILPVVEFVISVIGVLTGTSVSLRS